ncbi:MAG: hypothetical protein LQ349_009155 [Xanthoria aureola]|nr:MAG: hypothetical protein LQ349_009155 [Xanthoria aureola]
MAVTHRLTAALYVLAAIGFYGTWGRTMLDGTLKRLFTALHHDQQHLMSGTNEPLLRTITGIYWPIDYLLDLTAIATSGPWFLAAYFSISPLVDINPPLPRFLSSHLAEPTEVLLVPVSAVIGYIIPVVLMSLRSPSVISNTAKQLSIALWNVFPLTMTIIQTAARSMTSSIGRAPGSDKPRKPPSPGDFLWAVRICYAFSFVFSCTCHVGVAAVSGISVLFPMIFAPHYASAFRPGKVLIPPLSRMAVSSFGEGDLSFMKWDQMIGYACILIYTCVTLRRAQAKLGVRGSWSLYAGIVGGCVIAGPGSTVLVINWAKDELLFADQTDGQTGKGAGPSS